MASIVYYQAYEEELPDQKYTSDSIKEIIKIAENHIANQNQKAYNNSADSLLQ